ncbi:hypothetical protein BDV59DRAFT_199987 [Aspergillus ambiguus]|uniref:oxidase ustYa family protein n=1 Tax=Aspergillus ambiguus TaxID=176160 RepID=UPI003CCDD9A0
MADREQENRFLLDEENHSDTKGRTVPVASAQYWKWATIVLAIFSALQCILVWPKLFLTTGDTYEVGFSTDFGDSKSHIRLEQRRFGAAIRATEEGTLYRVEEPGQPRYTGNHSMEEMDAAWEDLIGQRYFLFEESEVEEMNQDPFTPRVEPIEKMPGVEQTGVYGGVDVLHSLHCLDIMRMHLQGRQHMGVHALPPDIQAIHIDHCVEQLRQTIMCSGDLTPVTLRKIRQMRNGRPYTILLGETERTHTCRNFEDIREWVTSRDRKGTIEWM